MTNSAHDDISIVDDYRPNSLENFDEDIQKVYKLIHDMQVSEGLGPTTIQRQKIRLGLKPSVNKNDSDTFVELSVDSIITEGWLSGNLSSLFNLELSTSLSDKDIDAIKNNEFSMDISLNGESDSMAVDDLLNKLEIYEAGRPSTIASIIEKLIQNKGLLSISDEHKVTLTQEGRDTHDALQKHFGDVANLRWNLKFASSLMSIGDGSLPPNECLLLVFEELYGTEEKEKVKGLTWTDPDVLHQEMEDIKIPIGGKISIGEQF